MRRSFGTCFYFLAVTVGTTLLAPCAQTQSPQSDLRRRQTVEQAGQQQRAKIGVALEGGGALGLAHIGVLQWFEDHHIPVDYIAGTSMGGLVAGLYATGKTPQQLANLVNAQNWDIIIGGKTPYEDLSYRRREDQRTFQNPIVVGLKHGLTLPAGLNAGQQISMLIDHETLPYSQSESFDDLPTPFRCVATELVSGKEEVFSRGSLQQALRATMSIPGVFSPVRDGEKIYVDGGLVGNLPTDVVRKMGADIVIAVHLDVAPANPKDIQSLFSVLGRSVDVVVHENELRGLAAADLIVNVNLHDYNSLDYNKSKTIIGLGTKAADEKGRILTPYSLDDAAWRDYLQAKKVRERHTIPTPQFVKVDGTNPQTARQMENFLQAVVGKPIDEDKLEKLLTRLTGIGKFDAADYRLATKDGQSGLLITVHEKPYAPPFLNLGFSIDGSESDDVTFTQLARLTFMDVAGYRSEWRTDLQFGNTYGVESELYRPFNATTKWFFAPRGDATDTALKIFHKGNPLADYRILRADIGMDIGYTLSRFTEIRVGYEVGDYDAKLRLGTPEFFSHAGRLGDTRLHFLTDHRDDPVVPHRGYSLDGTFQWFDTNPGANGAFPLMQARADYFLPVQSAASVFVVGEGGTSFGSTHIGVPQFFLGGPGRLSAYGTNELFGNQYYDFRIGYLHNLVTLPPFVGRRVYAIGACEFGKMYGAPIESGFPNDFAAGLLAETVVGPLFLGGSIGDTGHDKRFFQLGHVF
ncbi:MAG TPA: patatin-like phospholipase family protein [Candidatus Acidoferrales bacterium]|nr:patatin-like phospholipase family protein [Candidatus Acidoferrales bacterium]